MKKEFLKFGDIEIEKYKNSTIFKIQLTKTM